MKQYGRRGRKNGEPNDRRFRHDVAVRAKQLRPAELDGLLRDGEDEED